MFVFIVPFITCAVCFSWVKEWVQHDGFNTLLVTLSNCYQRCVIAPHG